MRIKIIQAIVGANFAYFPNEVVELEDGEAVRWCAAGIAVAVPVEPVLPSGKEAAAATEATVSISVGEPTVNTSTTGETKAPSEKKKRGSK